MSDEAPSDARRANAGSLHPALDDAEKERLFQLGVELFDQGRYFDAHEPWELIWRSRNPEPRDLYQGLVQVAAGFHHWFDRGRAAPAARLLERGARRLGAGEVAAARAPGLATIELSAFVAQLGVWRAWLARGEGDLPSRPRLRRARR
ncbi:MAG TPA: DUF309 domain-containing protein [Thermoanaerobaculia bacterium]|nr:DUF309 domain-containing protein [Thermoanaerobaculia bacterium]